MSAERVLERLRAEMGPIADRFGEAGHGLYLVGGVVRDALLGHVERKDLDLTTDALPGTVKAILADEVDALWDQGQRFGTIAAHWQGSTVEITTHRAERYDAATRKPVVGFGTDLEGDLERRDFTINAMAFDLIDDGGIIDPFDGRRDLERRLLRTPGPPSVSFDDDPLRVMRAARFVARFELTIDDEVRAAMRDRAVRIAIVSAERRRDELEGLLAEPRIESGLAVLGDAGIDRHLFGVDLPPAGAIGWAAVSTTQQRRTLLFHWLCDPEPRMVELRYPSAVVAETTKRCKVLDAVAEHTGAWSDADVRRVARAGLDSLEGVGALVAARWPTDAGPHRSAEDFEQSYAELSRTEDLSDLGQPLSGDDVMAALGLSEGRLVGEVLSRLAEVRIEAGPLTRETALALLDEWYGGT